MALGADATEAGDGAAAVGLAGAAARRGAARRGLPAVPDLAAAVLLAGFFRAGEDFVKEERFDAATVFFAASFFFAGATFPAEEVLALRFDVAAALFPLAARVFTEGFLPAATRDEATALLRTGAFLAAGARRAALVESAALDFFACTFRGLTAMTRLLIIWHSLSLTGGRPRIAGVTGEPSHTSKRTWSIAHEGAPVKSCKCASQPSQSSPVKIRFKSAV